MEDRKIVDLYWQRSENAIGETESKYGKYCRTIAYNILTDAEDAEECVNDTWLQAWNSMPDHRPERLAPFLGKMVRWISLSRLRERKSLKRGGGEVSLALEELAEVLPGREDTQQEIERRELSAAVRVFLARQEETERLVFLSRYWYMASIDEIAGKFGFSRSKVTSMLYRTRHRLQAELKEEGLC